MSTLSAKSESFIDSPSIVCNFVSRRFCGRLTKAAGGAFAGGALVAGGAFAGGAVVTRFAGALLETSLELQLDKPRALSKPRTTRVSSNRGAVQKPFLTSPSFVEVLLDEGTQFSLSRMI